MEEKIARMRELIPVLQKASRHIMHRTQRS